MICVGFNIAALMINFTFDERLDIEQLDSKGMIEWGQVKK